MGDVNFNFNFNSTANTSAGLWEGINQNTLGGVSDILSDIFDAWDKLPQNTFGGKLLGDFLTIAPGGCCSPPLPTDGSQPSGSLKTDGNVSTTAGGYKIEATGQFEWKITGPDGKQTRVWGDPHVAEGDGGKWDFKRNSTFVLGDGTRINVTTAPYGNNGMTVTQGLEIISGNDRVTVSGIDKGKGVVGQITQDGYAHTNSFSGDVFVMGNETDDWSHQGREIIGSNNGGDSFKLGNNLPAGNTSAPYDNFSISQWFRAFINNDFSWLNNVRPNRFGSNPYYNGLTNGNQFNGRYDQLRHRRQMTQAFRMVANMFSLLAKLSNLNDRMYIMRNRAMYA